MRHVLGSSSGIDGDDTSNDRKELWKQVSRLEKEAVTLLGAANRDGNGGSSDEAFRLLAKSNALKRTDPFLQLAAALSAAEEAGNSEECERVLAAMRNAGVPPHLAALSAGVQPSLLSTRDNGEAEEVDLSSTFSDTVTDKIRVKVSSFFDADKSDPAQGKFMFWYKVAIYNEGSEPVQIVARMWEIEKCRGDKVRLQLGRDHFLFTLTHCCLQEVVRGAGIMSTQPIIPPGDVFTYTSVCPLKLFPPRGKRVLGSMSGAYTLCKGNMGQHNFIVKIGKFNLILPESVSAEMSS
jgi:ApaG protein